MEQQMTEAQVVALMQSSTSAQEWNDNCDKVKRSYGGQYPEFWFSAIMLSGVAASVTAKF